MKVIDLEGNRTTWKPGGEIVQGTDTKHRSQLHIKAREIIYDLFPTVPICEEVSIKPRHRQVQYLDFYLHKMRLAIEVNGKQHYEFNNLYHATAADFTRQKSRDRDKREWCEKNGITLIELPYNKESEWKTLIENR